MLNLNQTQAIISKIQLTQELNQLKLWQILQEIKPNIQVKILILVIKAQKTHIFHRKKVNIT